MKLYHGTKAANVQRILREGIIPRGKTGKTNWKITVESNPHAVYLTNAYAGYFASNAANGSPLLGILEIDTDLLNESSFLPDEDFLEQASRGRKWDNPEINRALNKKNMVERTRWFRDFARIFQQGWRLSLDHMGTCCHEGQIPPLAITKAVIFDSRKNQMISSDLLNPTISILNFKFCVGHYRALTRWLIGEEDVSAEDYLLLPVQFYTPENVRQVKRMLENRSGLKIIKNQTTSEA